MKYLAVLLGFLFLTFPGFSQNLTLKELLRFRQMAQPEINRKLTYKGWTFISDTQPDSVSFGKAVWAFNPVSNGAKAWCILFYSNATPHRILYNSHGGTPIKTMQQKIRTRKMEILSEGKYLVGVDSLESYQDFGDNTYVMRLLTYKQPGYSGIKIFQKDDYLKSKSSDHL